MSKLFFSAALQLKCHNAKLKSEKRNLIFKKYSWDMNIVVLCGGTSSERAVSLSSSEKIADALKENGHSVVLLDVFFGSDNAADITPGFDIKKEAARLRELSKTLTDKMKMSRPFLGPNVIETCKKADIVFLGLHGENGEDGKIQAAFDLLKIKYTGSPYRGSCIAMSKSLTKDVISGQVLMAKGQTLIKTAKEECKICAPCVIKPSNGGSSLGVTVVKNKADKANAIEEAFKYDDTVLVEEFISGRELTQGVLGGKALPPVEIVPPENGEYDYENKYNGLTDEICPAPVAESVLKKMSETSLLIGRLLGLEVYYRIDYILSDDGRLFCLEANTLPGMTSTSLLPREAKEDKISYNELCETVVKLSLEKYE